MKQRKDILERKDDILKWISEKQSKAYMCRELDCKSSTLNSYLNKLGITYKGNKSHKGFNNKNKKVPTSVYLNNEKPVHSYTLKNRLIEENYKEMRCENCGLEYWQGERIPLELHHSDGNHFNNNLDNLKLLCPNCHALTDNYRGRAIKNHTKQNKKAPVKVKKNKNVNFCVDCGKQISRNAKRCKSCASKLQDRKCERPSRDVLKELVRHNSFLQIGKQFGLTDNAIRKWCKSYNLPCQMKQIKSYSDSEWLTI